MVKKNHSYRIDGVETVCFFTDAKPLEANHATSSNQPSHETAKNFTVTKITIGSTEIHELRCLLPPEGVIHSENFPDGVTRHIL